MTLSSCHIIIFICQKTGQQGGRKCTEGCPTNKQNVGVLELQKQIYRGSSMPCTFRMNNANELKSVDSGHSGSRVSNPVFAETEKPGNQGFFSKPQKRFWLPVNPVFLAAWNASADEKAVRLSVRRSVCLSVCPSNACTAL